MDEFEEKMKDDFSDMRTDMEREMDSRFKH
jgi:hypothetical protein